MRFVVAGRTSEGVTLPGLPALTIGRTDQVAWSFTNLEGDVQDLYRERIEKGRARRGNGFEPVVERKETIRIRGGGEESLVVRSTSNGPLLEDDLAVRWTALDPANLRVPNADFLRAADEAAFLATFDRFTGPPQNVVWASASGSIGWRPAGLLPVRRAGTDGSVPYDASDPENAWRGFVPMEELPRVVDPPEGFVVTANQRTIGTSFGYFVSSDWGHPGRARRIRDLLLEAKAAGTKVTRRGAEAIQLDERSETMRRTAAALRPFLPGDLARLLEGWDGTADAASARYLVARALRRAVRETGARGLGSPARPLASRGGQLERPPRGRRRGVSRRGARRQGRLPEGSGGRRRRRPRRSATARTARGGAGARRTASRPVIRSATSPGSPGSSTLRARPSPARRERPARRRPRSGSRSAGSSTGASRRPRRSSCRSARPGTSGRRTASTSSRRGGRETPTAGRRGWRARRRGLRSGSGLEERLEGFGMEADEELLPHAQHRRAVVARRPLQAVERRLLRGERHGLLPLRDDDLVDGGEERLHVGVRHRGRLRGAFLGDAGFRPVEHLTGACAARSTGALVVETDGGHGVAPFSFPSGREGVLADDPGRPVDAVDVGGEVDSLVLAVDRRGVEDVQSERRDAERTYVAAEPKVRGVRVAPRQDVGADVRVLDGVEGEDGLERFPGPPRSAPRERCRA